MKLRRVIDRATARAGDRPENPWALGPGALRASAIGELATGCALLSAPSVVIQALIGSPSDQAGSTVGRVLGGGLLALGVAGMRTSSQSPEPGVVLGLVVYNTSAAGILAVAGATGAADDWLLWPVVVLHGLLAAALVSSRSGTARLPEPR